MERYGTLPTKAYVVMEIGWEYNDENYYRPEDEGGVPKVAYMSKQDAVIACAEMNAKRLEQPQWQKLVLEYHDGELEYVKDFFEVKDVELINE